MKALSFWKRAVFWILFSLAVGGISTLLTRGGIAAFADMNKPPLTPPAVVFPIAWTALLILIGLGFALVRRNAADKAACDAVTTAYAVQMVFFFCWMIWFFGLGWYGFAAVWLLGMIAAIFYMIVKYRQVSPAAAWLQLPYLLWCCFALYLNTGIWLLNRQG